MKDKYLKLKSDSGISPHTITAYERLFRLIPDRPQHSHLLDAINNQRTASSRRQAIALLSAYCKWLVSQGVMPANPLDGMKKPNAQNRIRYLSDDEIDALLKSAREISTDIADYIEIGLNTGLRRDALI